MNAILHDDMTRAEAETINRSIKDCITETRAMLLEMRDRKGWKVLGYGSFEEYGKAELGYEQAYLYRLAQAAEVAARISTIVENPSTIPVTQLIPLSRVEPELQIEVFQAAQARAETENGGKVTAKIVETMAREHISRTKPKPPKQVVETQTESKGNAGIGDEGPRILADDISQTSTPDCGSYESWENQLGEILKRIKALPPIYRLYAIHEVESAAILEWGNRPESNAEKVNAAFQFFGKHAIPPLFHALLQGRISNHRAAIIASLPDDEQCAAMARLEIQIEELQAESEIPGEFESAISSEESTGIDGSRSSIVEVADKAMDARLFVICDGCKNFHPIARHCDAGYIETINFRKSKGKVPGKLKPHEPRQCDAYKPKHADLAKF